MTRVDMFLDWSYSDPESLMTRVDMFLDWSYSDPVSHMTRELAEGKRSSTPFTLADPRYYPQVCFLYSCLL